MSKTKADFWNALGLPTPPSSSADFVRGLVWCREVYRDHLDRKYRVTNELGVEDLMPLSVGDSTQWLHIRGRKKTNPILLYLHGGPGSPNIGFMDAIQRPWEDYFTVVQWDQRQVGKSYYSSSDEEAPITIDQMQGDLDIVVDYLLSRFEQRRLFILGHSWGSVLGMSFVKSNPHLVYGYVGVGQVVNSLAGERLMCERLAMHAAARNEQSVVSRAESIRLSLNAEIYVQNAVWLRSELSRLAGEALAHNAQWDETMGIIQLDRTLSPHLTASDLANNSLGEEIALFRPPYVLTEEFLNIDLPGSLGFDFDVPIHFFTGVHDWHTPRTLSDDWFSQINAPSKRLIHFEDSCHFVVNEEPGRFLVALKECLLPLVGRGDAKT